MTLPAAITYDNKPRTITHRDHSITITGRCKAYTVEFDLGEGDRYIGRGFPTLAVAKRDAKRQIDWLLSQREAGSDSTKATNHPQRGHAAGATR